MSGQLDIAARVLEQVAQRAGAGAEAEVTVERAHLALTRFANSYIHQNVADDTTWVRLRLHTGGRTATVATTLVDDAGLRTLADRVIEAARVAPVDPSWPGLTAPAPAIGEAAYDEATATASPAQRAERVKAFATATGEALAAGYCRTQHWQFAFANSAGQALASQGTEAAMDAIARYRGSDGVARLASPRLGDIDGARLGASAAAKARASVDAVELPPGRYEVVLEPYAVADLLDNLASWGFNGRAHTQRRSFVELGADQLDSAVTIVDDPFGAGRPGFAFDREGTPARRMVLVDSGTCVAVTHDRRTAALAGDGAASTGHALAHPFDAGPIAGNLELVAAAGQPVAVDQTGPATAAAADLVAGLRRGLLVTDLSYTRVLDSKTLVMTGLTRNGVWLVEDGQVSKPVQNFRFTQSYPQALGPGAVNRIGATATVLPLSWGVGWRTAPAVHLAGWNFTGGASG